MNTYVALQSVEEAHAKVVALRHSLEHDEPKPGDSKIEAALGEVSMMLDNLQVRFGLLSQILESSTDAVFAKDLGGRYLMINQAGADLFGRSVGEFIGHDDTDIFGGPCAKRIGVRDHEVLATGVLRSSEEVYDVNGIDTSLLTTTTAWYGPNGALRGLIGTAYDVAARGAADEHGDSRRKRLRSLASEIVITEGRLRQTLASELHSGLEQELALAQMRLTALRERAQNDLHEPITQITKLIAQAEASLRAVSVQLSPPTLHDLGLVPALEWLVEDMQERFGLEVRLENNATLGIPSDGLRVVLFRAIRELLVNTSQHAGVDTATVHLDDCAGALCITVSDTGAGFDAKMIESQGHGLFGIREQLEHLGGSLHIDSSPSHGTTAVLTAPKSLSALGVLTTS